MGIHTEPSRKVTASATPVHSGPAYTSVPPRASDRRANRRHKFHALVEMAEGQSGRHRKVRLGNLGRGGCYVETDNPLCLGQAAGILITKSEQSFQAQTTVVHVVPHKGMGLAFTTVNPEQHRILDRWVVESYEMAWLAANRRRSQRIWMELPVRVWRYDALGTQFSEETRTLSVGADGALILSSFAVKKGQHLVLCNIRTQGVMECLVVHTRELQDGKREVGAVFTLPNRTFWSVVFPPEDWSPHHPDKRQI